MGLSSSKPFEIFLSGIFEKVRCYSACCGGQVIVEESERYSGEDFNIID